VSITSQVAPCVASSAAAVRSTAPKRGDICLRWQTVETLCERRQRATPRTLREESKTWRFYAAVALVWLALSPPLFTNGVCSAEFDA
jgi:hypothetical protein